MAKMAKSQCPSMPLAPRLNVRIGSLLKNQSLPQCFSSRDVFPGAALAGAAGSAAGVGGLRLACSLIREMDASYEFLMVR